MEKKEKKGKELIVLHLAIGVSFQKILSRYLSSLVHALFIRKEKKAYKKREEDKERKEEQLSLHNSYLDFSAV
jgi:hypothetical protein